ncbi:hypothetical protein KAR91_66405 [Candidatus Pacearchaeota archaeon]|nr:hypothetical protein [Candidatus Pacearchaeota archaeon]
MYTSKDIIRIVGITQSRYNNLRKKCNIQPLGRKTTGRGKPNEYNTKNLYQFAYASAAKALGLPDSAIIELLLTLEDHKAYHSMTVDIPSIKYIIYMDGVTYFSITPLQSTNNVLGVIMINIEGVKAAIEYRM